MKPISQENIDAVADADRLFAAALAECGTLYDVSPGSLGISNVRLFAAAHGLPKDERYLRTFRHELLTRAMRNA